MLHGHVALLHGRGALLHGRGALLHGRIALLRGGRTLLHGGVALQCNPSDSQSLPAPARNLRGRTRCREKLVGRARVLAVRVAAHACKPHLDAVVARVELRGAGD